MIIFKCIFILGISQISFINMPRGRRNVKTISKEIDTDEVNKLFNEMISGKPDEKIVSVKIAKSNKLVKKLVIINNLFVSSSFFSISEFKNFKSDFDEFGNELSKFSELFDAKLPSATEIYATVKDHKTSKKIIEVAAEMSPIANHFKDDNPGTWIRNFPGPTIEVFKFSKLNLKNVWFGLNGNEKGRKFIFSMLSKFYDTSLDFYKTFVSPDIDTSRVQTAIMKSIPMLKKIPELSRCGRAFDTIAKSANLLSDNFDKYHRKMVASKDPKIIFVSLLGDISENCKADAILFSQFRKISNFYRNKHNERKQKDDTMDSLFDKMDEHMKVLERSMLASEASKMLN
jgi:hypothetical protein